MILRAESSAIGLILKSDSSVKMAAAAAGDQSKAIVDEFIYNLQVCLRFTLS